jgi:glycosyltransferase involved in cell wall biosynthesis
VVNTLNGLRKKFPALELHLILESSEESWQKEKFFLKDLNPQVKLHYLKDIPQVESDEPEPWIDLCPKNVSGEISAFCKLFQSIKPDLVHVFQDSLNIHAGVAAVLSAIPKVVSSGRNLNPEQRGRSNKRYYRSVYRTLLEHHPQVVFSHNSQVGASSYRKWLDAPRNVPFPVIYNGLVTPPFKKKYDPTKPFVVGSVFRFIPQKSPHLWLESLQVFLAKYPEAKVTSIGSGPMRDEIMQKAKALGLESKIEFRGHSENVPEAMKDFDVLLLTSAAEGLSNVLIEAQMIGLPVVCMKAGGSLEIVHQGVTGFVISPRSLSGFWQKPALRLAQKLSWIYEHSQWRRACVELASTRARNKFSMEAMVRRTMEVYTS